MFDASEAFQRGEIAWASDSKPLDDDGKELTIKLRSGLSHLYVTRILPTSLLFYPRDNKDLASTKSSKPVIFQ